MRVPEHYFSAEPASPAEQRTLHVRLRGRDVEVSTAGGVFSPTRLDLGTQVLLRTVPDPPPEGELLDLGCGWGPVTIALAQASPRARVWAVDVNARALDLTARNAERLGLTGVRAVQPDDVPEDVRLAAIWSNPPIRVGKAVLHEMLDRWLPRLADGGSAFLVVQRNLGADSLAKHLAATLPAGLEVERAASAKGFRVLRVTRTA